MLFKVRHTAELDAALDAVEETTVLKAQADALAAGATGRQLAGISHVTISKLRSDPPA